MASDVRDELNCSICLSIYTDPVTLNCGHNYCHDCIKTALCVQKRRCEDYRCPQCRKRFSTKPILRKNSNLCNIAETFKSREQSGDSGIYCTYCIHAHVPAVKSCLHCEALLCNNHLRFHNTSIEHVLSEPVASFEHRKCSIHKKILEHYCTKDCICLCEDCIAEQHQGHQLEGLVEASEKKKMKLINVQINLITKKEEIQNRVQVLQERKKNVQDQSKKDSAEATALFPDIRRRLEDLEKGVLNEILRKEKQVSLAASALIQQLEIKKDIILRKVQHIEEMCNATDPLTVLQDQESEKEEDQNNEEDNTDLPNDICDPDKFLISRMLHQVLSDIMDIKNAQFPALEPTDIALDVNTASHNVYISHDLKTASWTDEIQDRPEISERFYYPQVLSTNAFSSGQHYWVAQTSKFGDWGIGMCYPSIAKGNELNSLIGNNNKSWCIEKSENMYIEKSENMYVMKHDGKQKSLFNISANRLGIYLDYEAGQLSFYELCAPIRHLHTFNATFSEPLCVALYLYKSNDGQKRPWIKMTC